MKADLSEDLLRRSFERASSGLTDDLDRWEGIARRAVRRHRQQRLACGAACLLVGPLAAGIWARVSIAERNRVWASGGTVADVACTDDTTNVKPDTVMVGRDGIHLRLHNRSGGPLQLEWPLPRDLPDGITKVVLAEGPGVLELSCYEGQAAARLRVLDPHHLYVSEELTCPPPTPPAAGALVQEVPSAMGSLPQKEFGTPRGLTVAAMNGSLTAADIVERAGYPAGDVRTWRVRRGSQVWAVYRWSRAGDGWLLARSDSCVPR